MIFRIVDQSVVGINDTFGIAVSSVKINIAFVVVAILFFRKDPFVIAKIISADALARGYFIKISFAVYPAK